MINILNLNVYYMKLTKQLLEAVNRGIKLALDDYQDVEDINPISQTNNVIDVEDDIKDRIEFNKKYVDLGLPSGTIWAKYNLGADMNWLDTVEGWYGDYFSWGETQPKLSYKWDKYKWFKKWASNGDPIVSKYIICRSRIKYHGQLPDNRSQLEPEDDAAYVQTDGEMIMPTRKQFEELLNYASYTKVLDYKGIKGLNGFVFKSIINKKELFIPFAGYKSGLKIDTMAAGSMLCVWTSKPEEDSDRAIALKLASDNARDYSFFTCPRSQGISIRPIKNPNKQMDFNIEESILKYYEQYKNLTIQSQELKRLNNKHVLIDDNLLQQLLSKRVYNNIMAYLGRNVIPYSKFYEITQKYKLKLYGGKKFGYPEIDFSPEDPR